LGLGGGGGGGDPRNLTLLKNNRGVEMTGTPDGQEKGEEGKTGPRPSSREERQIKFFTGPVRKKEKAKPMLRGAQG